MAVMLVLLNRITPRRPDFALLLEEVVENYGNFKLARMEGILQ
jgi:hypothetical protein